MIGSVAESGAFVYIYNEKGQRMASLPAMKGLVGYTGSTVTVTDGHFNYLYNEKGQRTGTTPAR